MGGCIQYLCVYCFLCGFLHLKHVDLKSLKIPLKKLSWKDGNLFDKVVMLKRKLECDQAKVDKDVHNSDLRNEAAKTLKEYNEAVLDECKLLYQLAKVEWLKEGDKNYAYFHQAIKGRKHKSHINNVCDDHGVRYEGEDVTTGKFPLKLN